MRDGPSASCCHSAAHSASASSIVVDQPLIALQHGVEHRGVRLCAADQKEHLRVRRPAGAADLLSGRFAVIVQSAARRFYGIRLREPPENPPTAASARSARAGAVHPHLARPRHRSGSPAGRTVAAPTDPLHHKRRLHHLQHGGRRAGHQLQPAADCAERVRRPLHPAADRSGRMKTGAAGAICPGGSGFCLPVTPKSRSDVRRGPRQQRCR